MGARRPRCRCALQVQLHKYLWGGGDARGVGRHDRCIATSGRRAAQRRPRLVHRRRHRPGRRGSRCSRSTVRYGQVHACELEAGPPSRSRPRGRPPSRDRGRPRRVRRLVADRRRGRRAGPASRTPGHPLDLRAGAQTRCCCPSPSAGPRCLGSADLFIGVNALDYSGYPDCRPEYLEAFERTARLATRAGVEGARFRVHAPLIDWTKAQIIARGASLGLDYGLTHSCYVPAPDGRACGRCDSCQLRARGFAEAGLTDPLSR